MDTSDADSVTASAALEENASLKKKLALFESRKASLKHQLGFATYVMLIITMILLFKGSLQDADDWQQLSHYTAQLDACVRAQQIPTVFCHPPGIISSGQVMNVNITFPATTQGAGK